MLPFCLNKTKSVWEYTSNGDINTLCGDYKHKLINIHKTEIIKKITKLYFLNIIKYTKNSKPSL